MIALISKRAAKCMLLCCSFFLLAFYTNAQKGYHFEGTLIDASTREVLVGMRVCLVGLDLCSTTNRDGNFKIDSPTNADSLEFFGLGYSGRDAAYAQVNLPDGSSVTYGLVQNPFELSAVQVVAFNNHSSNASTPGSFGVVSKTVLNSSDQTSIQNALNTLPGVIMESRGYGGSPRINVRGSFLRSPFAVRNLKAYINGIPLSSPDGTSPLELFDVFDIEKIEVIKGPAGSAWGSGTGGVLLISAKKPPIRSISLNHNEMIGAYGLHRILSSFELSKEKWSLRVSHTFQDNAGYRDQEFNRKQQVSIFATYRPNEKFSYFLYSSYYNGTWGLPGALNASQVSLNPRQANAYSKANNAALYRERLTNGLSQTWTINSKWKNTTSLYLTSSQKFNPYGTSNASNGFKNEGSDGLGGRTEFKTHLIQSDDVQLDVVAGGELQLENFDITESVNKGGLPGDFKYAYDIRYFNAMTFASADLHILNRFNLNAGVGSNKVVHKIKGYSYNYFQTDSTASMKTQWLPRVALSTRIDSLIFAHASVSYGVSNPTAFEQIDVQNLSPDLQSYIHNKLVPEKGINYEFGIKGSDYRSKLQFELAAYQMDLSHAILPLTDTSFGMITNVYTYYLNNGSVRQRGFEASLRRSLINREGKGLNAFEIWSALSATNYTFSNYIINDVQYAAKRMPGVPLTNVSTGITMRALHQKISLSIFDYWFDRAPLNYANTVWSSSYHLLNTRLDVQLDHLFKSPLSANIYLGANNLLNEKYSSYYQLNGSFGKYYNPSPPTNLYGGLSVKWEFN